MMFEKGVWKGVTQEEEIKEGMLCMHTVNDNPRYGVVYSVERGCVWCLWCDSKQEALDVIPVRRTNLNIANNKCHLFYWKRSGLGAFLDAHT